MRDMKSQPAFEAWVAALHTGTCWRVQVGYGATVGASDWHLEANAVSKKADRS